MLQQVAISALVIVMMIAIGLRSAPSEFGRVFKHKRVLILSLLINVIAPPALLALVWHLTSLPEMVFTGFMICAASPGGATGPLFAAMGRGNVVYAVAVMITLSILSVFTAPLTLSLLLGDGAGVEVSQLIWPMMLTLILYQLLPLLVGMTVRHFRPAFADRASTPANKVANILLLAVIIGLLATKGYVLLEIGSLGLVVAIALVFANLLFGALTTRTSDIRRSMTMVTGVRNLSLALLISAIYFPDPLIDASILAFGLFTMLIPLAVARRFAAA